MEFEGDALLLIVANQGSPLQAMDGNGKLERVFQNPRNALGFIAAGGYVGIGQRKHIRYIRPKDPEQHRVPWASIGDVAAEISDKKRPHAEHLPGHAAPHVFGLKRWVVGSNRRISECRHIVEPGPRMLVKRDPRLPWSEANVRPVY